MIKAAQTGDLDMALRGFPIDEIGLSIDTEKIIEAKDAFANEATVAPSARYEVYFPITSAELTGKYTEEFSKFSDMLNEKKLVEVKSIDYLKPDAQIKSDYQLNSRTLCDIYGAEQCCEVSALLSDGQEFYMMSCIVAKYNDYWKILSLSSGLSGTTSEKFFIPVTYDNYQSMCNEKVQLELLWKKELSQTKIEEIEEKEKNEKEIISKNGALLPPNYFVVNQAYGKTPRELMEKFTIYIQRKDMTSMLNYGYMDEIGNENHTSKEILIAQKDFAIQLKKFYFDLLRNKSGENVQSLDDLGETAAEIVENQNPDNTFYVDFMDIKESKRGKGLYIVSYWYNGEEYLAEYRLVETNKGWKIKEFNYVNKKEGVQ